MVVTSLSYQQRNEDSEFCWEKKWIRRCSYIWRRWEKGGGRVVSARIAMTAAREIALTSNRSMFVEFGEHVELNRHWVYSLLHRMNFVQRKVTTVKSKHAIEDFWSIEGDDVVATVEMEEIPPELILNWDQTGIRIAPSNTWTMDLPGVYIRVQRYIDPHHGIQTSPSWRMGHNSPVSYFVIFLKCQT